MHTLPEHFDDARWAYTQVERDGEVAIYRQQHKHGPAQRFEVIVVQHLKEQRFPNGSVRDAGEYYPKSSQWGTAGWTFYTLDEARAYARTLYVEVLGAAESPR